MSDLDDISAALARIPNPIVLLESLFALAPVGFQIYEASGRSLLVNQAFRELFGSEPPPGYNVLRDEIAAKKGTLALIHRAFAGETIHTPPIWYDPRELTQVRVETGNRVAIAATFFPLFARDGKVSHVGIVFKDLTAELTARENAESDRDRLRAIIDQIADGIVVADDRGVVVQANRAAQELGFAQLEVGPERWAQAYGLEREDQSPLPAEETALFQALRGAPGSQLLRMRSADGSVRLLSASAAPMRGPDGSVRGAVLTARDETARAAREAETARSAVFRERFIAMLGHDLRTPLTSILGGAGLLLRQELPPAAASVAARIAGSAGRMERMIADLLDLARARLGDGLALQRAPCDVHAIAQAVLDEVLVANPGRRVDLEASGDTRGLFDGDRVAQLLSNLLENAVRYAPADGVISVKVIGTATGLLVSVHNGGAPIPEEERATIFDPFRRGRQATDSRGLGLGLFIVEQIALAHGGRADVLSSASGGTLFRAQLPRAP